MAYTVNYNQATKLERLNVALRDAKQYLGTQRFNEIIAVLRTHYETYGLRTVARQYRMALSLSGVSGLPAEAMMRRAMGLLKAPSRVRWDN
jgi:hypothetical protein